MTGFILRVAIVALGLWLATQIFAGLALRQRRHAAGGGAAARHRQRDRATDRRHSDAAADAADARPVPAGHQRRRCSGLVALLLGGFQISGFWTALGASLIVSITSWVASGLIGNNGKFEVMTGRSDE